MSSTCVKVNFKDVLFDALSLINVYIIRYYSKPRNIKIGRPELGAFMILSGIFHKSIIKSSFIYKD